MIRGPKYKIARRLGAQVFDKTQTQKFAMKAEKKGRATNIKHPSQRTDYGNQILEKQRARVMYGVNERQFSKYVKESVAKKNTNSIELLYSRLENRLDNVVYRAGLVPSRAAARQAVSHGHITVNGKKVTIPSFSVSVGDNVAIRTGSVGSGTFSKSQDIMKDKQFPSWIAVDVEKKTVSITGAPKINPVDAGFDLGAVIEFYSR